MCQLNKFPFRLFFFPLNMQEQFRTFYIKFSRFFCIWSLGITFFLKSNWKVTANEGVASLQNFLLFGIYSLWILILIVDVIDFLCNVWSFVLFKIFLEKSYILL
jgi:hypothetical protein